MEIPAATSFQKPRFLGFLNKLTGRGWLYSGTWKKRYCVLDGTKLYFYESEQSKGTERSAGVINLDYFDLCEEGTPKDSKRVSNVFVIGTSVRGFFDCCLQNRHLFSAETADEMEEWINEVKVAINDARAHRSRVGRTRSIEKKTTPAPSTNQGTEGKKVSDVSHDRQPDHLLFHATKYRTRGPRGRRLPKRKATSMMLTNSDDLRPRSTSLSALESVEEDVEEDDRWLSVSMEAVDEPCRARNPSILVNSYSSAENVTEDHTSSTSSSHEYEIARTPSQRDQLSTGRNVKQFEARKTAIMMELESKWSSSASNQKRPVSMWSSSSSSKPVRPAHATQNGTNTHNNGSLAILHNRLDKMENEMAVMRKDMSDLQENLASVKSESKLMGFRVENLEKTVPFEKLEEQLTSSLKEMQKMCEEVKRVHKEALQTRDEHMILAKECQEVLGKFKISANQSVPHQATSSDRAES